MVNEHWHQLHDYFNLWILPFVCLPCIYFCFFDRSITSYYIQYYSFLIYMIADFLFVVMIPNCVASPETIIIHHIITLIGWNSPLYGEFSLSNWICFGTLVEINTWFLIARRNFKNSVLLNVSFYISWFLFRTAMFPIVLYYFSFELLSFSSHNEGSFLNSYLAVWLLMIFLNLLNGKWTYDLVNKAFSKSMTHSKGL
jgi:hypothetical protein